MLYPLYINKMSELAKAWLSLFWNSAVFLLPEWSAKAWNTKWINYNNYFGLDKSIAINNDQSYWLFFTPNGNLWRVNSEWESVKRKQVDCEDYICCFYADLDKKDSSFADKTMDEYFDYIKETIKQRDFIVQFIVQSGGGFHLYSFVDRAQCAEMWQRFKAEFKNIQNSIADIFDWGDHSSHSINKLMRMPFSNHWKTATPKRCKLWKVDAPDGKYTFTEVTKPEQITLSWKILTNVSGIANFLDNQKWIIITNNKWQDVTYSPMTEEINKLPIVDVLRKLENYPRENDRKQRVKFLTDGNRIRFNIDWQIVRTDWYKVNQAKNYVNNFSTSAHPNEERPRWPVYYFLLIYFKRNMIAMWDFLKKEYNIDFLDWGKETFMQLPTDKWVVMFQDDWVYYRTTKTRGKETEDANEKLFDVPFIVKGWMKVWQDKYWETDDMNYYYIISLLDRDEDDPEEMIIEYKPDKSRFNNEYWKKWISFTKTDAYLVDFYSALKLWLKNWTIRKYSYINMNGYYPKMYIEWERIYNPEWDLLDPSWLAMKFDTPKIETTPITTEVTMKEYWAMLRKVFVDEESILCFVTFLVLAMWDKFWNVYLNWNEQQIIIPWLFISWKTKSGKSTMVNLLLNWFGLSSNCRRASVKWTTLQPLKQSATDDFILHREEFTGRWMTEEKENLIRDVLNKTKTARWMIDGTNARYTYRSSLVLDWERLPDSESVINRCVVVPFNIEGRIWTMELLRAFNWVGFKRDFITKLYKINPVRVQWNFREAQDRCIQAGILDRYSMLYGFLLCVNKWFDLFEEKELLDVIKRNLKESDELDREQTPLASILNEVINDYKVKPTLSEEWDGIYKIIIPIPKQLISQVKLDIMDMIKHYWANRMIFSKQNLVITISSSDVDELNKELYNTIILYKAHFNMSRFMDLDWFISD